MIAAALLLVAIGAGAVVLAYGLCRTSARGDAQIVDLAARRRLDALGHAVDRHPSGWPRACPDCDARPRSRDEYALHRRAAHAWAER